MPIGRPCLKHLRTLTVFGMNGIVASRIAPGGHDIVLTRALIAMLSVGMILVNGFPSHMATILGP